MGVIRWPLTNWDVLQVTTPIKNIIYIYTYTPPATTPLVCYQAIITFRPLWSNFEGNGLISMPVSKPTIGQASDFWLKLQNGLNRLTSGPKSLLFLFDAILLKRFSYLLHLTLPQSSFIASKTHPPSQSHHRVQCIVREAGPCWNDGPWCAHAAQRRHLFMEWRWNAGSAGIIGMADIPLARGYDNPNRMKLLRLLFQKRWFWSRCWREVH